MDAPETPPDPRADDLPCEEARRLAVALSGRSLPGPVAARLRRHLLGCEPCRETYRASLETAAALGRGLRDGRVRRPAARLAPRRLALFLLPCVAIFLLVHTTGGVGIDPTLRARWTAGVASAGETQLGSEEPEVLARRGDLLATGERGRLVLEGRRGAATLGPATTVLVESVVARRLRLLSGELRLEGEFALTAALGQVESSRDAVVRARVDDQGFWLFCDSGRARFLSARGEEALRAGEGLRCGRDGRPVPVRP